MKLGHERPALNERLKERHKPETPPLTEATTQSDQTALMALQMETFRQHCVSLLNNAQTTIGNDMALLLREHKSAVAMILDHMRKDMGFRARQENFLLLKWAMWLSVLTAACLGVGWMASSIMTMNANDQAFSQIGMSVNPTPNGAALTWDAAKLTLSECKLGAKPIPCLIQAARN